MTVFARFCRILALALLFVAGSAAADTPADGPWRLKVELSSFFDGHLGSVDRVVELNDGRLEDSVREDQVVVSLYLTVADRAVSGYVGVKAGGHFNTVFVPLHAVVVDGVIESRMTGPATMKHSPEINDVETRDVDIVLRLERQ